MDILKRKSFWFPSMESEGPRYALRCELQTQAHLWNRHQAVFLFVTFFQGAPGGNELHTLSAFGRPVGTHRVVLPLAVVYGEDLGQGQCTQCCSQVSQQFCYNIWDPHSKRISQYSLCVIWENKPKMHQRPKYRSGVPHI